MHSQIKKQKKNICTYTYKRQTNSKQLQCQETQADMKINAFINEISDVKSITQARPVKLL